MKLREAVKISLSENMLLVKMPEFYGEFEIEPHSLKSLVYAFNTCDDVAMKIMECVPHNAILRYVADERMVDENECRQFTSTFLAYVLHGVLCEKVLELSKKIK